MLSELKDFKYSTLFSFCLLWLWHFTILEIHREAQLLQWIIQVSNIKTMSFWGNVKRGAETARRF